MTKSILSQLSIIMTSSFDIVSPPRIRGGIRQVSGGTTAGPRRICGGIRVFRGGIESGQVRGSAGGLRKIVRGGERAGEKTPGLYCNLFPSLHWLIIRKTEKEDNSIMDLEKFTKSQSGDLHLRHNL